MTRDPQRSTDWMPGAALGAVAGVVGVLIVRARLRARSGDPDPLRRMVGPRGPSRTERPVLAEVADRTGRLALAAVYYGVLGPLGFLVRRRSDLLSRRSPPASSYWQVRPASRQSHEEYRVPF